MGPKFFSCFKKFTIATCIVVGVGNSMAGTYRDDFEQCLVRSITASEKRTMVRWMYSILSFHPDLPAVRVFSETELDEVDRSMAFIFTRLITQACKSQAVLVSNYEQDGIKKAFGVLGTEAVRAVSSHPDVVRRGQKFVDFLDADYISKSVQVK